MDIEFITLVRKVYKKSILFSPVLGTPENIGNPDLSENEF